jgi:methylmalonyl-CoA mutase cobalamin-binding subunit
VLGESLAERIAVLLGAKLGEDSHDQGAAAKLHAKVFEEIGFNGHTV